MEKRVRSFSALKIINNYLRSTMTDGRLNGLALLFVHPDITLDYDAVIDEFGKSNRRLQFCCRPRPIKCNAFGSGAS